MPWHIVARACFVAAVAWAAALLRPFSSALASTSASAPSSARHRPHRNAARESEVTDLLGALIGGAIGLGLSKTIGAALFWADASDPPRRLPPQLHPAGLPVPRHRDGRAQRGVARAAAAGQPVPRHRAAEALPHPRHQRHHRRPHRRRLRDRLPRRHARHPAVRAEGAAARRRLGRLAQAQPRPPRPRHPAEDPEDGRRRRHDLGHRLSRTCAKST